VNRPGIYHVTITTKGGGKPCASFKANSEDEAIAEWMAMCNVGPEDVLKTEAIWQGADWQPKPF
jgi:hypothetical protein